MFMTPKDRPATERDEALNIGARESTWGEAMGANVSAAWDWNILGQAQNSLEEQQAQVDKYGGGNWLENALNAKQESISKDDWPDHEHYREGIEWDESMNPVRAGILAEQFDERRARDEILARQTTGQKVAGFGVQMGVGFADPVNYIPFLGQAAKLKMIGRMGSVGGRMVASGIEAGAGNLLFNPVIGADLERRGETITFNDYAVDTVLGTGVGMLFGGAGGAWAKHFRGETKDAVLRGLQKAVLDVGDGNSVDVAPILKDTVEAGQFNRERAYTRLVDGGLDDVQAEAFLKQWDGLAAAQGMDTDLWVKKHIADVTVGGDDGAGIRFQAAMYRSPEIDIGRFVNKVLSGTTGKAKAFFEISATGKFEGRRVEMPHDTPLHIQNSHPDMDLDDLRLLPDALGRVDELVEGTIAPRYNGKPYITAVEMDGRHFGIGIEELENGRVFVTTFFEDTPESIANWIKVTKRNKAASADTTLTGESRLSDGRQPPSAQALKDIKDVSQVNSLDKSIHHRGKVRKAVERLQRKAKNAAPLKIVDSFDGLPEHVRARAAERGVDGVRGVHDGQTVYIVADAMESVEQAVSTWLHEQGVHHGLRGMVGDDAAFDTLMDSVFDHFGVDELDGIRQQYGLDFNNAAHRREAAEEMLAHLGEKMSRGDDLTDLEMSAWESIKAWFAKFLRERGLAVEMTDEDIAWIVKDAVRWTMDGGPSISRQGPQRFAVDGRSNGAVEFLPDGRARVRLFNGADMDQAGEALSRILSERFGEHPPAERLDWRTERPERETVDPLDVMEVEETLSRDAEDVQALIEAGRLTEEELLELHGAERGVEQAERISNGFLVAAECIVKGGA